MHKFTEDQLIFLRDNIAGRSYKDMTYLFNNYFGLNLSFTQIHSILTRYKFKNNRDGKFKQGQIPYNKGIKGIHLGGEATQFKSGQMPWNYKPVGSERVNVDGYTEIKIADPKKWKCKHVVIWESAYGPVPKGHAVIFVDRNRRNFDLDNLILVSRRQLSVLNKLGLISIDAELTKAGIAVADVYLKIGERRARKGRKNEPQ